MKLEQLMGTATAVIRVDLCSRIMGEDNSKKKGSEAEMSVSRVNAACTEGYPGLTFFIVAIETY